MCGGEVASRVVKDRGAWSTMSEIEARLEGVAKVVKSDEDLKALRKHLTEVVSGEAFRGSRRSTQFLLHVVDKAVAHQIDSLKERTIGVELFGRPADYDTGEDAIVRVTASEVRKRLLQHYGRFGAGSEFRVSLPAGGYTPEIYRDESFRLNEMRTSQLLKTFHGRLNESLAEVETESATQQQLQLPHRLPLTIEKQSPVIDRRFQSLLSLLLVVALLVTGIFFFWFAKTKTPEFPWSLLMTSSRPLQIITSDPNIAEIQGLTKHRITVSDYANQRYGCETLTGDLLYVCQGILKGDKAPAVDVEAVAKIAAMAVPYGSEVNVHSGRSLRMADLRTDNNYVFLGSDRTDPWTDLFSEQLDFKIVYDPSTFQDIVVNTKPQSGEPTLYKPTAKGMGTGQSYAIVALVRNPGQRGHVLLLEGASAEGTLAAANLVTDRGVKAVLDSSCKRQGRTPQYFEALLRVNTLAGASTQVDVIACHVI